MKIENLDNNQYIELSLKYNFDGYSTYDISGKNGLFSGASTICFEDEIFNNFIKNIGTLSKGEQVIINDNDSDSFIEVTKMDDLGHYDISYQVGGSHQEMYCKLILNTDNLGINLFLELFN